MFARINARKNTKIPFCRHNIVTRENLGRPCDDCGGSQLSTNTSPGRMEINLNVWVDGVGGSK